MDWNFSLVTMWFLLFFQPYDDYSDNLIASITQLQLFLTLWLGILIQLNDLNEESQINEAVLSALLVGTCCAVTIFGVGMIISEGIMDSRRAYREDKSQRTDRVRAEVRKRWLSAINYASYESQVERFGSLSFMHFNIPAMMEAFRRAKASESHGLDNAFIELEFNEKNGHFNEKIGDEFREDLVDQHSETVGTEEGEQMVSYVSPRHLRRQAQMVGLRDEPYGVHGQHQQLQRHEDRDDADELQSRPVEPPSDREE